MPNLAIVEKKRITMRIGKWVREVNRIDRQLLRNLIHPAHCTPAFLQGQISASYSVYSKPSGHRREASGILKQSYDISSSSEPEF
jgi:hypothetical protein